MKSIVLIFLSLVFVQAWAGEEYTKKITKSFAVNKDANLLVKNKFGDIFCENWQKDEIAIEVKISVEASSQDKANKYFDNISVDISGNASQVTAKTTFDDKLFNKGNNSVSVDYLIKMPKSISLDLDNKFGEIFIDEVDGRALIDLAYGNFRANRLNNSDNELEIKFSEGSAEYIYKANLELKYSEFDVEEMAEMIAESKFSELTVDKIEILSLESGYDEDNIGSVVKMDVEADFSEIDLDFLEDELVADLSYGELLVKEVKTGFSLIRIDNSFSDSYVSFQPDAAFKIDADIKMGEFDYRANARIVAEEISYTSKKFSGTIGDGDASGSKVILKCKNSDIKLRYK